MLHFVLVIIIEVKKINPNGVHKPGERRSGLLRRIGGERDFCFEKLINLSSDFGCDDLLSECGILCMEVRLLFLGGHLSFRFILF